jgi:hypothetical protein
MTKQPGENTNATADEEQAAKRCLSQSRYSLPRAKLRLIAFSTHKCERAGGTQPRPRGCACTEDTGTLRLIRPRQPELWSKPLQGRVSFGIRHPDLYSYAALHLSPCPLVAAWFLC